MPDVMPRDRLRILLSPHGSVTDIVDNLLYTQASCKRRSYREILWILHVPS